MIELIKPWDEYFLESLQLQYPDSLANRLYSVYLHCFSAAYKEVYSAQEAVNDIVRIERVVIT